MAEKKMIATRVAYGEAMVELGKTGGQLQLRYQDSGELAKAGWVAN